MRDGALAERAKRLRALGVELLPYHDAMTGKGYSGFIDATGRLVNSVVTRAKMTFELEREKQRYVQWYGFKPDDTVFADDTTGVVHCNMVSKAFGGRILWNPGNAGDAHLFDRANDAVCVWEDFKFSERGVVSKLAHAKPVVLALGERNWKSALKKAQAGGCAYFFATDCPGNPWQAPPSYWLELMKAA